LTSIAYVDGDATSPIGDGEKVIAHICNDIGVWGVWGAGFVMALSTKWDRPEKNYKYAYDMDAIELGKIQMVSVESDIFVVNLIAQQGVGRDRLSDREPVRYDALVVCLRKLAKWCKIGKEASSVHMPRIGCGLGGGRWEIVEPIIKVELCERGIPVTVYDWKG